MSHRQAPRPSRRARRCRRFSDYRLATAVMLFGLGVALWPLFFDLETTFDDGYYYLEIARRIAAGEGSTFDGLHPTNGYHPLWLLCLIPLAWMTSTPDQMLWGAKILQALLAAAATGLVYRICRLRLGASASAVAALVWIDLTYRLWLSGLEFALHAVCLLATAFFYLRHFAAASPRGPRPHLVLGLLCAATALARLDAMLLAVTLAATGLGRSWRGWRSFALPLAVAGIGYASVNFLLFGHVLPVSGAVKQEWSAYLLQQDPAFERWGFVVAKARHLATPWLGLRMSAELRPLGCGLAAALWWCAAAWTPRAPKWLRAFRESTAAMGPFIGYGVLHYLFYGLLFHGELSFRPWYYVVQPWLAAFLLAAAADGLARRAAGAGRERTARLLAAAMAALVLGLAFHVGRGLVLRSQAQAAKGIIPRRAAAQWIEERLPQETRVGAWNAGSLGWFSSRPVVNLDGLVNSREYFEQRQHDLCRYWNETGVAYLVDAYRDGQFWSLLPTLPKYRRCVDRLELSAVIGEDRPETSVRIYRFDGPRAVPSPEPETATADSD